MTDGEILSRLRRDPVNDVCLLRIGEADYGCEERPEDAPLLCWLLLLTREGEKFSREIPEERLTALHLSEGKFFRLSDLTAIE